jgi:PAS domain S-box-containing protein
MGSGTTDTSDLIRKLSRRQWMVVLAIVALDLGSLFLAWRLIANNDEAAELINLAGRQRMLSQRMALHLTLQQREPEPDRQRHYRDMAGAAAGEFERAHERLAATTAKLGLDSPIYALYFGPTGSVDAESRRYLSLIRTAIDTSVPTQTGDARRTAVTIAAAGDSLIKELDEATMLYQRGAEQKLALILLLLQISTLLIVVMVAFDRFRVFQPTIRRLTENLAAYDQAQHELRESEARFKAFSGCSSDWFWETDAQHRFSWTQGSETVQTPLPLEKVLGKTRLELRPEIEKLAVKKWQAYAADLDAYRPFRDFEYQIGPDDQALRWISVSGQPYFDSSGNFLGYRGTAKYTQERKDIEASLLRLQLAIEQSPVSIMITDSHAKIIYVNAHFTLISGYSAAEAIGRTPKILWSGEMPNSLFADMRKALDAGQVWHNEMCNRKKSGDLYWESQSISPVHDQHGKITHYVSISEDITALKQARRRDQNRNRILEAIANGTPLAETLKLMVAMAEAELPRGICTLQRLDRTQGKLFSACNSSLSTAYTDAIDGLQIGQGVGSCGTAAYTGSRVVVEDIASHPYWQSARELAAAEGLRACWSQPIISSANKVLGTLAIYYRSPRSPAADEIRVIELVSSLAAICLERDEAEQTLRQSEEQARALLVEHETTLNNALVGIVHLRHRRVISCNRRLEEIFGYDPGELIGQSSRVFYDSDQTFENIGLEAYQAVAEGRNFSTEMMLKHKDGSLFHGALNGRAIDPAQPQEGSIWIYADISERHRAEQQVHKLLQAVEQSPVSIIITSREGLIEYVNPRFSQVSGHSSDEALGQNPRLLQSGETPVETYRELWQTILAGREWRGVLRNRRKNGELIWEDVSISPIIDDMNQITHFLAVKEDITERKRSEDELEQHRAHLEELVRTRTADLRAALEAAKVADLAKDAFLANVSHELRTPLNAVIGLSELARRISTDPKQQDYLDKVTGAGKSLAGIINDLLDLSKIAAGHMEFEATSFSLRGLIQRSRSVMAYRAAEKGLELIERIDAEVPDILLGDPLRIEQILLNLLSNAIKFTAAGHVELRMGLNAREEHRVCLSIEVEDTGIGLAEESIAHLFQPFAQADASVNRKFGGTGLGLALCKRLAELMGGDISVTSREGAGTTFSVKIWLGLGNAADLPELAQASDKQTLPARYRNAQVLVVDDQPLNREIVEALLATVDITPSIATNGQEALDILRQFGPRAFDLVLMDIQMPIKDGLTAAREIRGWEGFAELPIIAMTAHTMEHEKDISTAAGMNDHIGKPFETFSFLRLLARWIPAAKQQMPADSPDPATPPAAVGLAALCSIDTQAGLARFAGNESRYRHWLTEFLAEAPAYTARIRQALAAGKPEEARQSAHTIKGRVGMLGMTGLHGIAAALEAALKQGAPIDDVLGQLQTAVDLLCMEIRSGLGVADPEKLAQPGSAQRPAGPTPESVAQAIAMLRCADGGSGEAIERCLAELKDTDWGPHLQQALMQVRNFDFDAAVKVLAPDNRERNTES